MAFHLLQKRTNKQTRRLKNLVDSHKMGKMLSFQTAEAYKLLRTNLMFSFTDEKSCKVIGYTSALRGEGKSLTVINTAYSLAMNGKNVLIIEADFRRPSIAQKLGLDIKEGLTNFLVNNTTNASHVVHKVKVDDTDIAFDVVVAGDIPPNPSELLDTNKMNNFLEACSRVYEYILIDLPPVTAVADAVIVSKMVDGMVVVVRQDYSDQNSLKETMRQLNFVNAKILGFIFNGYNKKEKGYYGKYKKYYKKEYTK